MGEGKIWKRGEWDSEYVDKIEMVVKGGCIEGLGCGRGWFYGYV